MAPHTYHTSLSCPSIRRRTSSGVDCTPHQPSGWAMSSSMVMITIAWGRPWQRNHMRQIYDDRMFLRAQSGHSTLREDQRENLGPPYDFRHNILMHKTSVHNWNNMKKRGGSRRIEARDRDIHFVPVEFLDHDPEMLRQYLVCWFDRFLTHEQPAPILTNLPFWGFTHDMQ